ncbi:peptidoglycan-binding protein [Micromonospora trifolii]|uniref:peptidoglycan-binding protein n=1 Tax=Micromonospora trifolii TaxID=2911208 RepID=UPI003CE74556
MDDGARGAVPQAATAGEYVALLRDVRRCSGLTYREISRRASAAGHWLPASTLATMLGRITLPRERTVVAMLAACGVPDVERWVEMRRDIEARLSERDRWETSAPQTTVASQPSPAGPVPPAGPIPSAEPTSPADPAAGPTLPADSALSADSALPAGPILPAGPAPSADAVPSDRPVPSADPGPSDDSTPTVRPVLPERSRPAAPRSARRRLRLAVLAVLGALTIGGAGTLLPNLTAAAKPSPTEGCPLVLRQGMYGPCVLDLQKRLVARGLDVPVDGWFGPGTTSGLIAFQALGSLPVSGAADAQVLDELASQPTVPAPWPEDRIGKYLRRSFPEDPSGAVEMARCLSELDPYRVVVVADGSRRWGLFQFTDTELSRFGVDPRTALDPYWNIRTARNVWSLTGGFGHWQCAPSPSM